MSRILCYHDVVSPAELERSGFAGPASARYKLTPTKFERHLGALIDCGLRPGLLGQPASVALTFDDGGSSALHIAEALERRGSRGHFLIATAMLGTPGFLLPEQVRELADRGHEVGSHSHTHPPCLDRLAPATLAYEWRRSAERLTELLGHPPRLAAVPGGRLSEAMIEEAAAAGYELLLSGEPTVRARHHGRITVLGRYVIWGNTPAARAAAYACGRRAATGWLEVQWHAKEVARRVSPGMYEEVRAARRRGLRSPADESGHGSGLAFESQVGRAAQTSRDQPLSQCGVVDQPLHSDSRCEGVVGRDEQRRLAQLADAADGRLTVIEADALSVDEPELLAAYAPAHPWRVVANLPYNVGTPLLVKWLTALAPPEAMTLMFQREVAERLAARAGESAYGRLGVLTQAVARAEIVMDLPARAFTPPPKVDSAVVNLTLLPERPSRERLAALETVTQAAFGQRRKMLRSSLRSLGGERLCAEAALDPSTRAEQIPVEGFLRLAEALQSGSSSSA